MESLFGCDAKLWAKYGTLNGQFGNNFWSSITFSIVRLWLGTMFFVWPLRRTAVGYHI